MSASIITKVKDFFSLHRVLLLILLLGSLLRLYRLRDMAHYDFDQEYVTSFVLDVVTVYPLKFVGQGLSVQGLFMGPFYFYFLVPFYLLFNLDPLGGAVGSVVLGLLIIAGYYWVAKELWSEKAGLIAAFIRAIGFYAISADWAMVPSYTSDLLILVTWWLLFKLWAGKSVYLPILFFVFGFYTSFHPIQFPFILVFFILLVVWKLRFSAREWLLSLVAFLAAVSPLLLFEYWRKWSMVKVILSAVSGDSNAEKASPEGLVKISRYVIEHWAVLWQLPTSWHMLSLTLLVVTFWYLWNQEKKASLKFHIPALTVTLSVFIAYYAFLPFGVPEYYLRATQAILLLYLSYYLAKVTEVKLGKVILATLLVFFSWRNALQLRQQWLRQDLTTLTHKQAAIDHILSQTQGKPFQMSYITTPGWRSGFDSLFSIKKRTPGAEGPFYTIVSPASLYPEGDYDFKSGGIGVIYPEQ